jgi:signal transduction histidine kinase/transcriptional regulator with GAF, ATPase, and Fis domain
MAFRRPGLGLARPQSKECGLAASLPSVPPESNETVDQGNGRSDRSADARPFETAARDDVEFLAAAAALLATAEDEATALTRLGALIVPRLADWCVFDMVRTDASLSRSVITHGGAQHEAWARTLEERFPIDPSAESNIVVRVLRTGESLLVSEVPDEALVVSARDAEHLELLRAFGIHSTIIVPLVIRGEVLGAVTFVSVRPRRRYDGADLVLAEALARQTSIAIDAARRRMAAERAAARTAHLQTVTAALGRATTPVEVARTIVEQGVAALEARAMAVDLLTADGAEIALIAATGYSEEAVRAFERQSRTSTWPVPIAIRTGQALWIPSRAAYLAAYPELDYEATAAGDYAFAAVPLEVEGVIIGGLGISFATTRDFSPEDRAFVEALARQCAQALERARLYLVERDARAAAERERWRAGFLAEASARLADSLDWEVTLATVAQLAVPALADWCIVDAQTDDGGIKRIAVVCADPAQTELAAEIGARQLAADRPLGGAHALATGDAQAIPEVSDEILRLVASDEDHLAALRRVGARSYLGVPLVARGRILGVMGLIAVDSDRRFGQEDLALAEELARRAALAADNARLFHEQVEARARVQELAAERALVLGQIADGVFIADPAGQITFANAAARRLHGEPTPPLPLSLVDYARLYRVRSESGFPLAPEALPLRRAIDAGETVVDAAWLLCRPDGTDLIVEGSAAPLRGEDGTLLGAVQTLQDVTARRAFEREKDAFVTSVTHDLKTPLTSVKGWAQLLKTRAQRDADRTRDLAALGAIVEQAETMQRLLDRLLETARAGTGPGARLRPRSVDLVELADRLVALHQGMTDRHRLSVDGDALAKVVGCFDPDAIGQIIGNLLGNAIKYSPAGGSIRVTVARDGDEARVTVRDRGIGIPAEALPSVFGQYFRAANAVQVTEGMPVEGQGLGLFSAQNLAVRHGGRIEAESVLGEGSAFTLILPLGDCP